jgi:hypothetical protein
MKYIVAFMLVASVAVAYITSPDKVAIDGRILLTTSRPMASFPWKGEPPRISEHPNEGVSESRELDAFWEISDGRLYLLAVSAFRFDDFAPVRSIGLRELMPERIKDGKVLADWFTGDFDVLEVERVDRKLLLRPQDAPPMHVVKRKFHVEKGRVKEGPNQPPEPTAMSVTPPAAQEPRQP